MDRDRLKQVHQSEITESRINEDFVIWLKTKAPTWVLAILVGFGAYLGVLRWKQHKAGRIDAAWRALIDAQPRLPGSKEDVAEEYADTFAVAQLAWLGASTQRLVAVARNRALGSDVPGLDPQTLSAERREEYLTLAAEMCHSVLLTDTDGSLPMTLHAVNAMKGLAAVEEARGNVVEARRWYLAAADRAERDYPKLAELARRRAETVDEYVQLVSLPSRDEVSTPATTRPPLDPARLEPGIRTLLP